MQLPTVTSTPPVSLESTDGGWPPDCPLDGL